VSQGKKRSKWNDYSMNAIASEAKGGGPSQTSFIPFSSPGSFSTYWHPTDDVVLQGKLVSAVRGHDFNLAVNVAQGKQTADMVVSNLLSIARSIRAIQRGNFQEAARFLGAKPRPSRLKTSDVSGRWLEMQYGWLPMLSDTYEAVKAYEVLTRERKLTFRVSRTVRAHGITTGTTSNYKQLTDVWAGKVILAELSETLSAPRSCGLYDPLSVVWEIIPYSFVIDWFLPVGSFLDNLSVIPMLRGRFLTTLKYVYEGTNVGTRLTGLPASQNGGAFRHLKRTELTRTLTSSLSTARPSFVAIPAAMSAKRVFNAIALSHQMINPRSSFGKGLNAGS
jgi:hypothetical protein